MQTVLLGTAQWGLDYGATNAGGRLSEPDLDCLLSVARRLGIHWLDTASAYGDAEVRIGQLARDLDVQTKVSAMGLEPAGVGAALRRGLERLATPAVASCLVHDWPSLDAIGRACAASALTSAREDGLVRRIGISGYSEDDLLTALREFPGVDVIQVPVSVLDQRLEGSAPLAELRSAGVRIQARSVFLQGVALTHVSGGPFSSHRDVVSLRNASRAAAVSSLDACVGYIRSRDWIDEVVVAPTTAAELEEISAALRMDAPAMDWQALASSDPVLLDPRRWANPTQGRIHS